MINSADSQPLLYKSLSFNANFGEVKEMFSQSDMDLSQIIGLIIILPRVGGLSSFTHYYAVLLQAG